MLSETRLPGRVYFPVLRPITSRVAVQVKPFTCENEFQGFRIMHAISLMMISLATWKPGALDNCPVLDMTYWFPVGFQNCVTAFSCILGLTVVLARIR